MAERSAGGGGGIGFLGLIGFIAILGGIFSAGWWVSGFFRASSTNDGSIQPRIIETSDSPKRAPERHQERYQDRPVERPPAKIENTWEVYGTPDPIHYGVADPQHCPRWIRFDCSTLEAPWWLYRLKQKSHDRDYR